MGIAKLRRSLWFTQALSRSRALKWANGPTFCLWTGQQKVSGMALAQKDQLVALLEPTILRLGYELADLELQVGRGHGRLRLFIDNENGITLEDCETVSRQVSSLLDVEDPIPGEYSLEVSSPGLDRRLVKREHFDRFAGSRVKLRLRQLLDGRRNFKATLVRREDEQLVLDEDGTEVIVPLSEVEVARLVPEY